MSRATGFGRVVVMAAALGSTFLVNTYQSANTAPNVVFELVAAGVLTSVFVPTFVEYLVRREKREGWDAASVLTSVAVIGLVALALLIALAAPWIMRLLTIGVDNDRLREQEIALGATFLRLFAPQVVFYGVGMVMTGALHAYRKFALPALAPIFNNVVVIATYLLYARMRGDRLATVEGITTAETLVLGVGTTLGVVAMTVCLIPQLHRLGWRFRWRFDLRHAAVRKAARIGAWALGYAGGYQAGLIVVLMLANRVPGGVAAYQWAYVFFFVPHALFAAPIFHVLFPAMSEHATRGETESLASRLRSATTMLVFILAPIAAALFVVAQPLVKLTLEYGLMTEADAETVSRVLSAFAVGLPTYSAFLVLTRAYYALEDPKTPTVVNALAVVVSSAAAVVFFFALQPGWRIAGLAFGHSIGFAVGTILLVVVLQRRSLAVISGDVVASLVRSTALALLAGAAMWGVGTLLEGDTKAEALLALAAMGVAGAGVYAGGSALLRVPELRRIRALVRGRSEG